MRTVTFLGLVAIADAIRPNWHEGKGVGFCAVILCVAIVMDLVEFFKSR